MKNLHFGILFAGPGGEKMSPEERRKAQKKSFPQGRPPSREPRSKIFPDFDRSRLETGIHTSSPPVAGSVKGPFPAWEKTFQRGQPPPDFHPGPFRYGLIRS